MAPTTTLCKTVLESSPSPMLLLDGHTILMANQAACHFLEANPANEQITAFWPDTQPDGRASHQVWPAKVATASHQPETTFPWHFQPATADATPIFCHVTMQKISADAQTYLWLRLSPQEYPASDDEAATDRQQEQDALAIVRDITDTLYRARSLDMVIDEAVTAVMTYTDAPSVALFSLDADRDRLTMLAGRGFADFVLEVGTELPLDNSLTGITIQQRQIITTNNLETDTRLTPTVKKALLQQGFQGTVISVPLLFQNEVYGAMNLIYQEIHPLSAWENRLLFDIGRAIGLAISNAQHVAAIQTEIQERQQVEAALTVQLRYEHALAATSQALLDAAPTAVTSALHHLLGAVEAEQVRLFKNNSSSDGDLSFQAIATASASGKTTTTDDTIQTYQDKLSRWQQAFQDGQPIHSPIADLPANEVGWLTGGNIGSILALPITTQTAWLGFVLFESSNPDQRWTDAGMQLLQTAVNLIGAYIERQDTLAERNRLFHAVEQSANLILITNRQGIIEYANPTFEKATGFTRQDWQGKTPRILKSGHHPPEYYTAMWDKILAGHVHRDVTINKKKNGELYYEEKTITPIRDESGHISHFLSTAADITEKRHLEEQTRLRLELSQALAATRTEEEVIDALLDMAGYYPQAAIMLSTTLEEGVNVVRGHQAYDSNLALFSVLPTGMELNAEIFPTAALFSPESPFVSHNLLEDERVDPKLTELAQLTGARSMAVIPMTAAGDWLGNISLIAQPPHYFNDERLELYTSLAKQGAMTLRAASLSQEIQTSLMRRSRQLRLTTQIAQAVATATNLDDLYQRVVDEVQEQFGFYHTQLLRYDPGMDHMALVVGYGDVGQKMLAMHHSMPVGVGLIGTAAATGRPVLRRNVSEDPNWQPNPLLPETRSELAVPIKTGESILGVLDIQSNRGNGFSEDDQLAIEGLCGQIAIAIESTRLRQEMSSQLSELQTLQRYLTREAWETFLPKHKDELGYLYDLKGIQKLSDQPPVNGRTKTEPLAIRGETIGLLHVEEQDERPLTSEDITFIEAVSEQVAEALDAARLLEQTQEALTEQERLAQELETVADVTTAASTILDIDKLLQKVVDLAKASFNLYHAHIYLLSDNGRVLQLSAGAGTIGRLMVLEGHQINLATESLVARAARTRRGFIENDVRSSVDFLPNPNLPRTRAEMAVPMVVGDKLIGVLDLQADRTGTFTEEDLKIQTTLASQIAVAIQNATLYATEVETTEKLRTVDQLKSEFLASMSHELRTPLNSIIGFADVLLEGLDGELNERMEEDVRLIRDSGRHLRNLIGDILDMSKIEAGRMELRYEEIDMRQMASDIIATAQPLANEKGLFLTSNIANNVDTIQADRTRLRQVLWNIMGNAIKFTEKGGVTLSMAVQNQQLLVSIKDTGIGIEPEDTERVFAQFRQVDSGLNRAAGGTGLGMPISRNLVELHGGEIWIESEVDKGTTFHFTLPLTKPAPRKTSTGMLNEPSDTNTEVSNS